MQSLARSNSSGPTMPVAHPRAAVRLERHLRSEIHPVWQSLGAGRHPHALQAASQEAYAPVDLAQPRLP